LIPGKKKVFRVYLTHNYPAFDLLCH